MKSNSDHKSAKPVFDGRSGQRNARARLEALDGLGLLGVRVLDGLRLVQDHEAPGDPRSARAGGSAEP